MIENSLGAPEDDSWHLGAAYTLRQALKERGEFDNLRKAVKDERFWTTQHFTTGMAVRNFLRSNGFSETEMNIWNLDDHYIPIMLLAVGYRVKGGYNNKDLQAISSRLEKISD